MVFSSAPLYLDPHNWHHHQQNQQAQLHQHQQPLHQQQNQQLSVVTHGGVGGGENPHHHQLGIQTTPTPPSRALGSGSSSSIRPGSMAERAREAKIPHPEPGLKCPRCESTNTKFCYFNNYNLTQPRHFCKMCRRYWTRGGALRNVPVGGGCRRNKRSGKGGGVSKASGGGERQIGTGPSNNSTSPISSNSNNTEMNNNNKNNSSHGSMLDTTSLPGHQTFGTRLTQFPLLATSLGLNFGEMMSTAAQGELGFQIGASSGNLTDQWRPYHFPNFLAGFDPPQQQVPQPPPSSTLYHQFPIDHQSMDLSANNQVASRSSIIPGMNQQYVRASQLSNNSTEHKNNNYEAGAAVKAEGVSQGGMNLMPRSFLGMSENSQYSVGNNNINNNSTWTDMSGPNSSTTNL